MGIQGLLSSLKGITYTVDLKEYKGVTAGVDAYCWLHRGTYTCCTELVLGEETDKYVSFCMGRVKLLQDHGITPIMVFDGASLPIKRAKNDERRLARKENRERAITLYHADRKTEARQHFQKAVDVTHLMARKLIKALQSAGVRYLIAPYEADAQLAYLSLKGLVDIVITEDSDTIPYGCRKVLFKMDKEGNGQEIDRRNLGANEVLPFENWTDDMFLDMCLLAGCDYLTPISGLGIKTAHKLVKLHRTYKRVLAAIDRQRFVVPEGYAHDFYRARMTFRHQRVYDPVQKRLTTLHPLHSGHDGEDLSFLGPELPPDLVEAIISGTIDPNTHRPFSPPEVPAGLPIPDDQGSLQCLDERAKAAAPRDPDEEKQTRIVPSWKRTTADLAEGLDGEATALNVSIGDGVYESMNYHPQAEHHAQSLRKIDRAMSVTTLTCSSRRAGERDEGLDFTQHANKGQAQRLVPKAGDDESPPPDENTPPSDNGAGRSSEVSEENQDMKGSIPMGSQQAANEVEPPRWSSYFSKSRACGQEDNSHERRGLVNDASTLLQRMQEKADRDRQKEMEKSRRRKRPLASAPWSCREFHSPFVSDQVETLHRRKRRGGFRGTTFEQSTVAIDNPLQPQRRDPSPSRPLIQPLNASRPKAMDTQGPGDIDIVEDREDYIKFVPRFKALDSGQEAVRGRLPSPLLDAGGALYYEEGDAVLHRPSLGVARFSDMPTRKKGSRLSKPNTVAANDLCMSSLSATSQPGHGISIFSDAPLQPPYPTPSEEEAVAPSLSSRTSLRPPSAYIARFAAPASFLPTLGGGGEGHPSAIPRFLTPSYWFGH